MFMKLVLLRRCFSETKPKCDILLSFRRKLSALEYLASAMKVAPEQKRRLPPEESSKNRVVKTFFSGPEDVDLSFASLPKTEPPNSALTTPDPVTDDNEGEFTFTKASTSTILIARKKDARRLSVDTRNATSLILLDRFYGYI